jgi:hypothetical protein
MAKKKSVNELSADELFQLAEARKQEEEQTKRDVLKNQLSALRQEKRALVMEQRKALTSIDNKIKKLRRLMSPGKSASGGGRNASNVSAAVLNILGKGKQMGTKEIQAALTKQGIVANNLSQTLSYLKRQGKITSPQRSIYAIS